MILSFTFKNKKQNQKTTKQKNPTQNPSYMHKNNARDYLKKCPKQKPLSYRILLTAGCPQRW